MFTFDEVDGLEDLVWIDETTGQPLEAEEMVPRLEGAQSQYCQRLLGRVSELEKEVQRSRDAAGSSLGALEQEVKRLQGAFAGCLLWSWPISLPHFFAAITICLLLHTLRSVSLKHPT